MGLYAPDAPDSVRRMWEYGKQFSKPVLYTEFGGDHFLGNSPPDVMERSLHAGLWSSCMSPLAGSAMFWWWLCVDEKDLYPHLAALVRFMQGEDRRDGGVENVRADVPASVPVRPSVLAVKDNRGFLAWIYDRSFFPPAPEPPAPQTFENARLTFPDVRQGRYRVEFWDTRAGAVIRSEETESQSERLVLTIPPFQRDIACKVRILDPVAPGPAGGRP